MAGGAYDVGKSPVFDKDPTRELQHSIAKSRQEVAIALANLNQSGSRDLLGIIQSLIGQPTTLESMYHDFELWVKSVWQPIQDLYDNFEDELSDFLATWNISLGSLSPIAPNLQIAPEFNSEYNVSGNSQWVFDPLIGDPSAGSFKVTCNGKEQAVTGTPIQVQQGQKVDFKIKFKWYGLVYTGNPLQLKVREIDTGKTVYLAAVVSPGTNGGFVEVTGTYTTPAGVTRIKIRPTIDASATAGTVWIDSGAARKNGVIQQQWVEDLVEDFNDTWDAISGIFEAFGSINNEADFQNAVGKLLSLFGIEHPDDLGSMSQADFWSAIWISFMKPLGLIASQESIDLANARTARKTKNDQIIGDWFHTSYPLGTINDTAETLVNGKRTWFGAWNDNLQLLGEMLGITPPTDPASDVGTAIITAQATTNQISDIFDDQIVTPINDAVQQVKDWWESLWKPKTSQLDSNGKLPASALSGSVQPTQVAVTGFGNLSNLGTAVSNFFTNSIASLIPVSSASGSYDIPLGTAPLPTGLLNQMVVDGVGITQDPTTKGMKFNETGWYSFSFCVPIATSANQYMITPVVLARKNNVDTGVLFGQTATNPNWATGPLFVQGNGMLKVTDLASIYLPGLYFPSSVLNPAKTYGNPDPSILYLAAVKIKDL